MRSRVGICDEGRVTFISSYRNDVSYQVGQRRFSVGHEYVPSCDGMQSGTHRYWCKDNADAEAVSAYVDAERAEYREWATRRGLPTELPANSVRADYGMWHVLVYGTPAEVTA